MAYFDVFETGFNNFDETINFGKRAIAGDSLFEICTFGVIRSSDTAGVNLNSNFELVSCCQVNGKICVGINSRLVVLKSTEEPDCLLAHEFDNVLEGLALSGCGQYIIVTRAGSYVVIGNLSSVLKSDQEEETEPRGFPSVFQENIEQSGKFLGTFSCISSDFPIFYVVTECGLVKKYFLVADDNFVSETVYDFKQQLHIAAFAYPYIIVEGTEFSILNLETQIHENDDYVGLHCIFPLKSNLLALDNSNTPYIIEPSCCQIYQAKDTYSELLDLKFLSMVVLDDGNHQLVIGQTEMFRIIAYSQLTCLTIVYDIPSEYRVHFLNFNAYLEDVVFVAEVCKENKINELRLQFVTTTEPEVRVRKLIKTGDLDKAELFAKQFGVDPDVVLEAKALNIIGKQDCSTEDINLLLDLLDSIENTSFKMQCCHMVTCQLPYDMRRVLNYGVNMQIGVRDMKVNLNDTILAMKYQLIELLAQFNVYMNIYKVYNQQQWKRFSNSNRLDEIIKFLRQGDIKEAIILSTNTFHNEESVSSLTDEIITDILFHLNTSSKETLTFLNAFIPVVLKYRPESAVPYVNWLRHCILRMNGNVDFPECAIRFLNETSSLVKFTSSFASLEDSRECLVNLRLALSNIQSVMNNFSVRLSLVDCLNGRMGIVETLLNLNTEPLKLECLMREFVLPFLLKRGEDPNRFIYNHLVDKLKYEEKCWTGKAHLMVRILTNMDLKLDLIRLILESTSKPWSDEVKKVSMLAFQGGYDGPKLETIKKLLKDEPVLVVLQKYQIKPNLLNTFYHKQSYFYRILYRCGNDIHRAFNDIRILNGEDQLGADYFTAKTLLYRQQIVPVLDILDDLPKERRLSLCKMLFQFLYIYDQSGDVDANLDALKLIYARLLSACNYYEKVDFQFKFNTIKGLHELYKYYGLKAKLSDFSIDDKRRYLRVVLLKVVELLSETDSLDFAVLLGHCKRLSPIFDKSTDAILTEFATLNDNFDLLLQIAEQLEEQSKDSELLVRCATAILNLLVQDVHSSFDDTFLDVIVSKTATTTDGNLKAIQLARRLCTKAVHYYDNAGISLSSILEVINNLDYIYCLDGCDEEMREFVHLHHIYLPKTIYSSQTDAVRITLTMHRALCDSADSTDVCYLQPKDTTINQEDIENLFRKFFDSIDHLLREEQHFKAAGLVKVTQLQYLSNLNPVNQQVIKVLGNYFTTKLLPALIDLVIGYNYLDTVLFMDLMMQLPKDQVQPQLVKYLKQYKRQAAKLQALAEVGLSLFDFGLINMSKGAMLNIQNLCKWWFKLNEPNISYSEFFSSSGGKSTFMLLVEEDKLPLECFPEFCTDFNLDLEEYYFYYLKTVILNWKPDIEYNTEIDGRKTVTVKNMDVLTQTCERVVACFSNIDHKLVQFIVKIWPMVNFYYYEVYLVLLKLLENIGSYGNSTIETYRPVIMFLTRYNRVSPPNCSEIEQWFGLYKFKHVIDPMSAFRLPLSPSFLTDKIWDIIEPEITLDTYKNWLELSKIGLEKLSQQMICTYAIKSVTNGLDKTDSEWDLCIKHENLVNKVDECASNTGNLEFATAAIYNLMCEMPPGVDKVQMAQLSYKYAKLLLETERTSETVKVFEKMKQRYLTFSVMHILHKYQLTDIKYSETVTESLHTLVNNLYNDRKILAYFDDLNSPRPEINKAVKELCELYENKFKGVKVECLRNLLKNDSPLQFDWRRLGPNDNNSHIKRAIYICDDDDKSYWENFLLKQYRDDSHLMSFKTNSLICLYFICDSDTLERMCGTTLDNYVSRVNKMVVISQLINYGIRCDSVTHLDESNKKSILKQLVSINKPATVRCTANLCRIYEYDDLIYWDFIVKSSLEHKMMDDLRDYLVFLCNRSVTRTIEQGWRTLLDYEFNKLNWDVASEADIFSILQGCPVYNLDLSPWINQCLSRKRSDLADLLKRFTVRG